MKERQESVKIGCFFTFLPDTPMFVRVDVAADDYPGEMSRVFGHEEKQRKKSFFVEKHHIDGGHGTLDICSRNHCKPIKIHYLCKPIAQTRTK